MYVYCGGDFLKNLFFQWFPTYVLVSRKYDVAYSPEKAYNIRSRMFKAVKSFILKKYDSQSVPSNLYN